MANTHSVTLVRASSQWLSAPDSSSLDITGNMTIEMHARPNVAIGSSELWGLVNKVSDTGGQQAYGCYYAGNGGTPRLVFTFWDNGGTQHNCFFNYTLPVSTFTHIAFVYSTAGTVDCYVNGVAQTQATGKGTTIRNTSSIMRIGLFDEPAFSQYGNWKLDDIRIWAASRTSTEINDNMFTELTGSETNLRAYWKLNNSLADSTSNGNTLTNNNTATFTEDIAFDAIRFVVDKALTVTTGATSTTSVTIPTHASNNIIWAGVYSTGSTDVITGVTWGGVALTRQFTLTQGSNARLYLYRLPGGATGTANLVVSQSASVSIGGVVSVYAYVAQTGIPDSTSSDTTGTSTTASASTTTVIDKSWVIGVTWTNRNNSNDTGVIRGGVVSQFSLFDSGGPKTPAGSAAFGVTLASSSTWAIKTVSFAPYVPVVASSHRGMFHLLQEA